MVKKIGVLGAGAGGCAVAAHMALSGHNVNIYDFPKFKQNIEPIKKQGGIAISGTNVGFGKINIATTDIGEAINGADLLIIAVQSLGQRLMAEKLLPHLEDGQIICYVGEPAGSLEFAKVMKDNGVEKDIVLGETNTLPYDASRLGPAAVKVIVKRGGTIAASFPAKNNPRLLKPLRKLWPFVTEGANVFETILLNYNAIDHIPPGLLNVGRLETPGVTRYWGDGCTPGVARVIQAVSDETIAIRKTLGFKDLTPYKDLLYKQGFLESQRPTTYEAVRSSIMAGDVRQCRPTWLREDRLIIESLPYGLRLISSIGDLVAVETPVIDALITLASIVNEVDYWEEGRTIEKLGISRFSSVEKLNNFLYRGA